MWSNENAFRRKCSRTRPVASGDVVIRLIVRDESMALRDLAQPPGDQPPARVPPSGARERKRTLTRGRRGRKRRAQRLRRELVRMEVEDGELLQSARDHAGRKDPPVAAAPDRQRPTGRDGKLPELSVGKSQPVGDVGNATDALTDTRRVVLARVT